MAAKTAVFPKVLNFPRKGTEDVFLGENGKNEPIRGKSEVNTDSIRPKLSNQLANLLDEIDQELAEKNEYALQTIQEMLCQKSVVTHIRDIVRGHEGADYNKYLTGIDAALTFFEVAANVNVTQFQERTAKQSDDLSINFIRDRIKPILETYQILVKREDNTFRWATLEELERQLATLKPANDLQSASKWGAIHLLSTCNSPIRFLRTRKNAKRIAKAKQDPFARVKGGQIEYLSLPYQGELTEDEKQLLRQLAKAEAREKLQGKLARLDDKEFQREIRAAEKAAMQQAAALSAEASVKAAEVIARRQVRNAKLAGYVPVVSILAVFGIVAFMISHANQGVSLDAGNPAYTQIQQASMDDSVPVSPIPSPEETQQQLLEMEAALQRLDSEVPAQ